MLETLFGLLATGLGLYFWLVIVHVIVSLIIGLGIMSHTNVLVKMVHMITNPLVETLLVKIRTMLPFVVIGPLDLSPVVLLGLVHLVGTLL